MSLLLLAEPLAHKTGEAAKAGPIGLAVIVLLCVACYFLFKSMSKHMRNVRDRFPDPDADMTHGATSSPENGPDSASDSASDSAFGTAPQPEHVPPRGDQPPSGDA